MPAVKLAWMRQTARVSDHLEVPLEGKRVVADSHALVRGVQARLEPSILRRHAGRARVRMAAHRLDAADRKQKPAADVDEVGAKGDMGRDFATRRDLARGNQVTSLRNPSRRRALSTAMSASTNGNPT